MRQRMGTPAGHKNQEHWIRHAEEHGGTAAFFVIHAKDYDADGSRKIESIDDERVFIGQIVREGTKTFVLAARIQKI